MDDGFTCLGVDDSRQDRRAVANGTHDATAVPDVGSDCLQALRCWVVVQSGVACGGEEEAIVLLSQIGCLLQLRRDLDHERMLRIVQDRVVTPGQEGRRKRNIVEAASAGLGCQIHLKSRSGQHFIRVQSLYEEYARLVAAGIDGSIKARDCNERLARQYV